MSYDAWRTTPPDTSRYEGILEQECDCMCDHTVNCEDGCNPADSDVLPERGRWVCIGGTRYRIYDTRED
jgi:hypothetical protein